MKYTKDYLIHKVHSLKITRFITSFCKLKFKEEKQIEDVFHNLNPDNTICIKGSWFSLKQCTNEMQFVMPLNGH